MDCYQRFDSGDNNAPVNVRPTLSGPTPYQDEKQYDKAIDSYRRSVHN